MLSARNETLVLVLYDVRAFVALPTNDFMWSWWNETEDALRELDALIARVETLGDISATLHTLFAPTGPLQEVSISSGWGDDLLELADRFEYAARTAASCHCLTPPFRYTDFERKSLGVDQTKGRFAEVSVDTCRACAQKFLHYQYELEGISRSGRWYRAPVCTVELRNLLPEAAPAILATRPWYYFGGSYFESSGQRTTSPLKPQLV